MGRGRGQERDILDWWLTRQLQLWWQQWRWVIIAIALLLILRITYDAIERWFLTEAIEAGIKNQQAAAGYELWRGLLQLRRFLRFEDYIYFPIAVFLASTFVVRLVPPGELALTRPTPEVYRDILRTSRQAFWCCLGLLVFAPPVLDLLWRYIFFTLDVKGFFFTIEVGGSTSNDLLLDVLPIVQLAGILLFLTEWQLALLLRFPFSYRFLPLYMMPTTITIIAHNAMRSHGYLDYTNYAPALPWANVLPQADDIWIAVLHLGALAAGLWFAARWWPRVAGSCNPRKWWWLIGLIGSGLALPALLWLKPNIWLSRIAYMSGAFFRGTYIGNPFAGWSSLQPLGINPYAFDWQQWRSLVGNYQCLDPPDHVFDFLSGDLGVAFSPWVYIPIGWAVVWCVLYYAFSVTVIWRANNRIPRGFRGTWDK